MSDLEYAAVLMGEVNETTAFGACCRKGLFNEYINTLCEEILSDCGMQLGWHGDAYAVYIPKQRTIIGLS
jgi:hypothetical protein